jgi:hypothetical protein
MFMSLHQNAGKYRDLKVTYKSVGNITYQCPDFARKSKRKLFNYIFWGGGGLKFSLVP